MKKNEEVWRKKLREEISHYAQVENVHELPPIFHYWSNKYLRPKLELLGFNNVEQFYIEYIKRLCSQDRTECKILSVGAGNCDLEANLSKLLVEQGIINFLFTCLDINPHMLQRGKKIVNDSGLASKFIFLNTDINSWEIDNKYHVIIANQSLHHFVELEILFNKINDALYSEGFFLTHDMIGRNGHMRWPEALEFVNAFWSLLDDRHKYNHQLKRFEPLYDNWDCSREGFEGIRSQDILPLLLSKFKFDLFIGFSNLISIFVDRSFGHNFDPNNELDRTFIDFFAKLDDYYIELGKIKPTQMIAAMTKEQKGATKIYKHLTPEFCLRIPD
ncbi:MAG: hypothetical protein A2Y97_01450 [Nitrospirae bacterium RBG_13_39_12]|nr:MAG: hypothetical protein A2Y97_01450 [Nitrospirae bacterium RBG_13_39_12]